MKRAFLIVLVVGAHLSLFAAPRPAVANSAKAPQSVPEIPGADVIAFVRLTGTSTSTSTNKTGQQVRVFTCYATVERAIKGTPGKKILWKVSSAGRAESVMEKTVGVARKRVPGNPVLLVFLNRVGDAYTLNGSPGVATTWTNGTLRGSDRVDWSGCLSVDEVVSIIQRSLKRPAKG